MPPKPCRNGTGGLHCVSVHDVIDCLFIWERICQRAAEISIAAGFDLCIDEHDHIVEGLRFYGMDKIGLGFQRFKVSGREFTADLRFTGFQHLAAGA